MKEIAYSHSFKNLYLIGNGFDIHHRIRCKYPDFQIYLHERKSVLENRLFQVYDLHLGNLWSSLEDNLGEITPEAILDNSVYGPMVMILTDISGEKIALSIDDYSECVSEIGYTLERLYNALQTEFINWILQLESASSIQKVVINKEKSAFVSFNYTQTLENTYGISSSKILYIHGCAARNDNLIFGHNKTPNELLKKWGNQFSEEDIDSLVVAAYELCILYKDVDLIIEKNALFWETIKNVEKIHVWGLSLSEVDIPYIKYINSIITHNSVQWEFSWYSESDKKRIVETIDNVGITQYSLVKLEDLMASNKKGLSSPLNI